MNTRKIYIAVSFIVVGFTSVSILWKFPLVLSIIIVVLSLIKHKISPIRKELIWYLTIGFIGVFSENIIIYSGAWNYGSPHISNVPLWLFFLWGFAGITAVTLYEGLTNN